MDLKLQGLRAFVTGASRGLGFATALGLVSEGVEVAINSRSADSLRLATDQILKETGRKVTNFPGDATDPDVPDRLIQATIEALGGLDLLITNTGGPPPGSFDSFDDSAWQRAIELCLMSHVRLIRAALPYLRQSKSASVLTVTSYSVKQPIPNLVLSNSVRSATIGLTKSLALELGREGIRVNSILPAGTETKRIHELMGAVAKARGTTVEEELRRQSQDSPLGRIGTPEEFANAAVFLLSPAASYITGVMLNVDGGMYKGTF
jgi:3-oxoacyl-[acyl-carrier protein] reductase